MIKFYETQTRDKLRVQYKRIRD